MVRIWESNDLRSPTVASPREATRLAAAGEIEKLWRGEARRRRTDATWWDEARESHDLRLLLASATSAGAVACRESAVLVHGGRLFLKPAAVHLNVSWHPTGRRLAHRAGREVSRWERKADLSLRPVIYHHQEILEEDIVREGELLVTSIERTIIDSARMADVRDAVVAVDSLFAALCVPEDGWRRHREDVEAAQEALRARLLARLATMRGQRGVRRARAVVTWASAFAESPQESEARRLCLAAGIAPPLVQPEVMTRRGLFHPDLGWWLLILHVLEIDGDIKYQDGVLTVVLTAQIERQQALEERGVVVHRARPALLRDPTAFIAWLRDELPPSLFGQVPVRELRTSREAREWA